MWMNVSTGSNLSSSKLQWGQRLGSVPRDQEPDVRAEGWVPERPNTLYMGNIVSALHGTCFELPPAWDGMENVQTLFKRHHKYIKNG